MVEWEKKYPDQLAFKLRLPGQENYVVSKSSVYICSVKVGLAGLYDWRQAVFCSKHREVRQ